MPEADSPCGPHGAVREGRSSAGDPPAGPDRFGGGAAIWRVTPCGAGRIGILAGRGLVTACALGKGGVRTGKREGDGATPAGLWPVRRLHYRPGRLGPPRSRLAVRPTGPRDGWCDQPDHPAYNRRVRLPIAGSAERLQRPDRLYDLVIELGYNDSPPRPGAGSAIFMHVARPGLRPTAGCIAVPLQVLRRIAARMRAGDLVLVQGRGSLY